MCRRRIGAFEQLFVSGSMAAPHPSMHISPYQFPQEFINTGGPAPLADPQGMIPVPDDLRRLHEDVGSQIYSIPQTHQVPRRNNQQHPWQAGMLGKLMVGSLAGLMIMEGFHEQEQDPETPAARGLFALPGQLGSHLRQTMTSLHTFHDSDATSRIEWARKLRLLLVLGIALYIFLPSLFWPKSARKEPKVRAAAPVSAPSLAAPLHVRRQAWLTAIQTVWVPRHNFFLEAAALVLKMWKLSLRNAIGSTYYTLLTGTTEEQEKARVKSWTIALDALLAGGDVEVSKSRLTLTLLASGTLPTTPQHLMLQALHIRVLLWEMGNAGFNGIQLFHKLTAKLARWKWTEAQQMQQILVQSQDTTAADLPEHLAALLMCSCDDVLDDIVVQRAHNLTWNLPTTSGVHRMMSGMDDVVDDVAIRSPLDAVAAWYSGMTVHEVLMETLSRPGTSSEAYVESLELALQTAPIGSSARLRALAVRAVLDARQRGAHIASTLAAVAPASSDGLPSFSSTGASYHQLPDVNLSLRCAMTMAHLERSLRAGDVSGTAQKLLATVSTQLCAQTQSHQLTLLGFVSAHELMQMLALTAVTRRVPGLQAALESMAALLRLWMGGSDGGRTGVDGATRNELVEGCLTILRGGCAGDAESSDDGYGSMSECEGREVGGAC